MRHIFTESKNTVGNVTKKSSTSLQVYCMISEMHKVTRSSPVHWLILNDAGISTW